MRMLLVTSIDRGGRREQQMRKQREWNIRDLRFVSLAESQTDNGIQAFDFVAANAFWIQAIGLLISWNDGECVGELNGIV